MNRVPLVSGMFHWDFAPSERLKTTAQKRLDVLDLIQLYHFFLESTCDHFINHANVVEFYKCVDFW